MKQVITKEEVSTAIEQLTAQGKRPTLAAIHALLDRRGSMSTLVRLKAELEASSKLLVGDSPEGLRAFRQTWAMAVAEGRQQQDALVLELRESLNALATENEKLEGLLIGSKNHAQELELASSRAESELKAFQARVQVELDESRATASQANTRATEALSRLAEGQEQHARQMVAMQAERDAAVLKAHEMEIKLTRALALLEAAGISPCEGVRPS